MASQTIAFFGATGGCTSTALALTLKAGYKATALARTPKKLHDLLLTLDVPESTLASNLTIVQGPAQDVAAVKATIAPNNVPVSQMIFGIGGTPKFQPNPLRPFTLDNPHVCEEATKTILTAVRELTAQGVVGPTSKPTMMIISTTGISNRQGDVPLAFIPLYHYALAVPHKDKRIMEDLVIDATKTGLIKDFVMVRPSLLIDGEIKGLSSLRVGWEMPGKKTKGEKSAAPGPAVGYVISRSDVGNWIYEKMVKEQTVEYNGKCVSLTY